MIPLSLQQKMTLINALHHAEDTYKADCEIDGLSPRIIEQFTRQAKEAAALCKIIEDTL